MRNTCNYFENEIQRQSVRASTGGGWQKITAGIKSSCLEVNCMSHVLLRVGSLIALFFGGVFFFFSLLPLEFSPEGGMADF